MTEAVLAEVLFALVCRRGGERDERDERGERVGLGLMLREREAELRDEERDAEDREDEERGDELELGVLEGTNGLLRLKVGRALL